MNSVLCLFFTILLVHFVTSHDKVRYDNYRVYTVIISSEHQLNVLKSLENDDFGNYSIWCYSMKNGDSHMDIMISPQKLLDFQKVLEYNNIKAFPKIMNIQKLINTEEEEQKALKIKPFSFGWENYHSLSEINDWLDFITRSNPEVITPFVIGKSYEGRDIKGIKISYKSGNPGIFIESHIHAREWITSATVTYFINELINSNRTNIRNIAENVDWYIIPNINPDGFEYSRTKDRLWRKTRQPNQGSSCIGTDGNRNFDSHWLENGGASNNPCAETYAGPKPFSEPEMQALDEYYSKIKNNIGIYLSIHSYGQLLLSPYGHSGTEFPPNYDDMQAVAKATTDSLKKRHNTGYRYGSTASVLYVASGVSPDWAYNTHETRLAYTFELRDTGKYGFILPPSQIIPTAEETTDGIVEMVNTARKLRYL